MSDEIQFYSRILAGFDSANLREDPVLQAQARSVIPVAKLEKEAQDSMRDHAGSLGHLAEQDLFLLELLDWFKNEFFHWTDAPDCQFCAGKTRSVGMVEPTSEELRWLGSRVENYQCNVCSSFTRFPRYNNPGKLLETRRGRCGEWANCFTLCSRAAGFEVRQAMDWTDHTWTEVYSESQKRWVHCDACENVYDKPLLYEAGWGKKLTYVLSFAADEMQDVTWRYSAKHAEVLNRRNECREEWLVYQITKLNREKQSHFSPEARQTKEQRLIVELVEFMSPKTVKEGEDVGRTSGSLYWRQTRGELGEHKPFIFKPTPAEFIEKKLVVQYCPVRDLYIRPVGNEEIPGWENAANEITSIQRKIERDWKMVYLSRSEGAVKGMINWEFDISAEDFCFHRVSVTAIGKTFEDGQINWTLQRDGDGPVVAEQQTENCQLDCDVTGARKLILVVRLTKGRGNHSWQHAQLFRQGLNEKCGFPLQIVIEMKRI